MSRRSYAVLVIRIIHTKYTEADVRYFLGSAIKRQLCILRFNFGLDFLSGTTDTFLADFAQIVVAQFSSNTSVVAFFR